MNKTLSLLGNIFLWSAALSGESLILHSETFDQGLSPGVSWGRTRSFASFNPDIPLGGNDGALWQGRGFNWSLSTSLSYTKDWFSFLYAPDLSFSQNLGYVTLNGDGDYWWGLDRVQRYSRPNLWHPGWGESEVRATFSGWSLGLGNQALRLGTSTRQNILLSDNAGGFPHIDLGTLGAWATPWGRWETHLLWGALYDSNAYVSGWKWDPSAWRFFHGLTLAYSPPFAPEWTLGGARLFYSPLRTVTVFKMVESIADTVWKADRGTLNGTVSEDDVDQMIAVYFDVHYPQLGFHAYAEVARNDHAINFRDFMLQPDHSLGYVVGVRQGVSLTEGVDAFIGYEQGDTSVNGGTIIRPTGSWYRHGPNPEGYTLGGQLLGAAMGPGSNYNYLEVGGHQGPWTVVVSFERLGLDNDYVYQVIDPPPYQIWDLDVRMTTGLSVGYEHGDWRWSGMGGFVKEFDHNFRRGYDLTNYVVSTEFTYRWGNASQ